MFFLRPRFFLLLALCLLAGWGIYFLQPERQVRRHQRFLLEAVQKRDWPHVQALMAENVRAGGWQGRELVVRNAQELMQWVPAFSIAVVEERYKRTEDGAILTSRLRLAGSAGTEGWFDEVNRTPEPFLFTWQRETLPWRWRLAAIAHPLISRVTEGG